MLKVSVCFASGDYPWTIIRSENRDRYFSALEVASVQSNIRPFAEFVAGELNANSKSE